MHHLQAEDGDVWREVVRDGARAGGGETGPSPQPLSQRLSGLKPDTMVGEAEVPQDAKVAALAGPSADVAQTEKPDEGQASMVGLRLDNPVEAPWHQEGDIGSPVRGPPKTPKRNKASSPQLSDVSRTHGALRYARVRPCSCIPAPCYCLTRVSPFLTIVFACFFSMHLALP